MNAYKVQIRYLSWPRKREKSKCAVHSRTKILISKLANSNIIFYIRHLSDDTREDDLYKLSGFCSKKYLKENYDVKMSTNS